MNLLMVVDLQKLPEIEPLSGYFEAALAQCRPTCIRTCMYTCGWLSCAHTVGPHKVDASGQPAGPDAEAAAALAFPDDRSLGGPEKLSTEG